MKNFDVVNGQESPTRCACWTFWYSWRSASTIFTPSAAWSPVCHHYRLPLGGLFRSVELTERKLLLDNIVIQQGWPIDNWQTRGKTIQRRIGSWSSSKVGRLTVDKQEVKLYRGGLVPGLHATQDKLWQEEHVQWPEAGCAPQYRADWLSIICRVFYETVIFFCFSC